MLSEPSIHENVVIKVEQVDILDKLGLSKTPMRKQAPCSRPNSRVGSYYLRCSPSFWE